MSVEVYLPDLFDQEFASVAQECIKRPELSGFSERGIAGAQFFMDCATQVLTPERVNEDKLEGTKVDRIVRFVGGLSTIFPTGNIISGLDKVGNSLQIDDTSLQACGYEKWMEARMYRAFGDTMAWLSSDPKLVTNLDIVQLEKLIQSKFSSQPNAAMRWAHIVSGMEFICHFI